MSFDRGRWAPFEGGQDLFSNAEHMLATSTGPCTRTVETNRTLCRFTVAVARLIDLILYGHSAITKKPHLHQRIKRYICGHEMDMLDHYLTDPSSFTQSSYEDGVLPKVNIHLHVFQPVSGLERAWITDCKIFFVPHYSVAGFTDDADDHIMENPFLTTGHPNHCTKFS